jgi:HD-like signal output (HDOD) protein
MGKMNKEKVKDTILDKINSIPTIPQVIRRLIPLLQNENVAIDDLLKVISSDVAITSRLLKVANSAYYGLMKNVTTVRHAVAVLGMRQVKSLALGITVFENIKRVSGQTTLDYKDLWLHSIGCGMAAAVIADSCAAADKETVFTAALLHDMGKLPLSGLFAADYGRVVDAGGRGVCLHTAEQEVFGFDHATVGGWLCDYWKFPKALATPIRLHHTVNAVTDEWKNTVALVACADYLSRSAGIGHGGNSAADAFPDAAAAVLALQTDRIDELIKTLALRKEEATSFFDATQ